MKNTTIAFTCSLAGTLALLALNGRHATQGPGHDQRTEEAMLKYEFGHNRIARAPVAVPTRVKVANVTPSASSGSAQGVVIAWARDRR